MELVALKIKIGLKPNGHAEYPDFNSLASIASYGGDWSHYVDEMGLAWHYDKTCGHKEYSTDSEMGKQWGMLMVPEDFALEAIVAFPDVCARMTGAECEDFYDNKAHAHESYENTDDTIISGLKDTLDLMERIGSDESEIITLKSKIKNAMDPTHSEPGVKKNMKKTWADFKGTVNATIKEAA